MDIWKTNKYEVKWLFPTLILTLSLKRAVTSVSFKSRQ